MKTLDGLMRLPWTLLGPERIDEDGGYFAIRIAELPDFFVAGESEEEVNAEFTDALRAFLESYTARGELPPLPGRTGGWWAVISSEARGSLQESACFGGWQVAKLVMSR